VIAITFIASKPHITLHYSYYLLSTALESRILMFLLPGSKLSSLQRFKQFSVSVTYATKLCLPPLLLTTGTE